MDANVLGWIKDVTIVAAIPAAGWWLKNLLDKRDKLQKDNEDLREKSAASRVDELKALITGYCAENKRAHDDIWDRVNGHHHEVECNSEDCGKVRTGNVIIDTPARR